MDKDLLKVRIDADKAGEVNIKDMEKAGWSADPGTGKAVMLPDENGNPAYEVLNPMPFAPPIGWEPTPPIEELIRQRVREEVDRLKDEDVVDDLADMEDFDIDDELPPLETIYEIIAMEPEAPRIPPDAPEVDIKARAKADLEYEEALAQERILRRRHREAAIKKQQEEHRLLYGDDPPAADGAPSA